MPRTIQQNQLIRDATRSKLLRSAITLFSQLGYAHTSIRKIAADAEVSVGLLYHYFDNKEDLLRAVFEDCMHTISQGFTGIEQIESPQDRLIYLLTAIFETLQADPFFWGLFYSLRAQPAVHLILEGEVLVWTDRLRAMFVDLLTGCGFPQPETEAYYLYSLIEGTIQQYLLAPKEYPLHAVVARIMDQFTNQPNLKE